MSQVLIAIALLCGPQHPRGYLKYRAKECQQRLYKCAARRAPSPDKLALGLADCVQRGE